GQEVVRPVTFLQNRNAALDLLPDRGPRQAAVGAEAPVVAVHATADRHAAVHVGTGKPPVDGHAVDLRAKTVLQKLAEGVVTPLRRETGRHRACVSHGSTLPTGLSRWRGSPDCQNAHKLQNVSFRTPGPVY